MNKPAPYDPNSLITGRDIADGKTYGNSYRIENGYRALRTSEQQEKLDALAFEQKKAENALAFNQSKNQIVNLIEDYLAG